MLKLRWSSIKTYLQGMATWLQVASALLLLSLTLTLMVSWFWAQADVASVKESMHRESLSKFNLLHSALLESVISEDIPVMESFLHELERLDGQLSLIEISNEKNQSLVRWMRETSTAPIEADHVLQMQRAFELEGIHFGDLRVDWDMSAGLAREAQKVWRRSMLIGLLMLLFCSLVIALLHVLLLRPLRQAKRCLEEISAGELKQHLNLQHSREMQTLSMAVNQLSEGLVAEKLAEMRLKTVNKSLNYLQRQNQQILNSAAEGIVGISPQGLVTFANPAALAIAGFNNDDFLDSHLVDSLKPSLLPNEEDVGAELTAQSLRAAIAAGEDLSSDATCFTQPGGQSYTVDYVISPIIDEEKSIGAVMIFRDISEREQTARELRLAATAFDSHEAIMLTDKKGTILRVNPAFCAVSGYRAEEVVGEKPSILHSGKHSIKFYQGMWRKLLKEGRWDGEVTNRSKSGQNYPSWLSISAVKDPRGNTSHYVSHGVDISKRKRAEAELRIAMDKAESASRVKAGFFAMMSHEIRTPLNGVLGVLGLLRDSPLNEQQSHYVKTARDSGEVLLNIINDILDFSKMEAGKLDFENSTVQLDRLVDGIVNLLRPAAFDKGLKLTLNVHPDCPKAILGDPGRLRQVLLNLVSNALKFTPSGEVTIKLEPCDLPDAKAALRFSVTDSGIGIAQEQQGKLFAEFSTLDASYSRKYGGTGLGLAICKKLIDMMKGRIDVRSSEGVGSCFYFEIPVQVCELGSPPLSAEPEGDRQSSAELTLSEIIPARILLVDDVPANRLVAKDMLERVGHSVDTAVNGLEALKAVEQFPYDLVLMDVSMPEMDGLEATQKIRLMDQNKARVPIIAMTAHAMMGDKENILAAGMDDYLAKPFIRNELLQVIARWQGQSSSDQHLAPSSKALQTYANGPVMPLSEEPVFAPAAAALHDDQSALFRPEGDALVKACVIEQIAADTHVDMIPELLSEFIKDAEPRVEKMIEAFERLDYAELELHSHALGSSSGTYGLPQLFVHSREIEACCREQDYRLLPELMSHFKALADESLRCLADFAEQWRRRIEQGAE